MSPIAQHILSLILTFFVEFLVIYFLMGREPIKLLSYSLIINMFTLPIATNLYLNIFNNFLIIEVAVFLAESLLLMWLLKINYEKAVWISFFGNGMTSVISLLFFI